MTHQKVLILDFGGQYNQLIARRVREQGVYCDLMPSEMSLEKIKEYNPIGIIFTGGPNSVYEKDSPKIDKGVFSLGIPVLGICYGCQLAALTLGGTVESADTSEYGKAEVWYSKSPLTKNIPDNAVCWMSHTDRITKLPK
ncbi:MAG: GMP synthase (glutamine-hydrolyzing), partial [Clostridia bacterium]|nr:GMP synthase (glutamine-hydrolyzing) [Clostridia bacterium]